MQSSMAPADMMLEIFRALRTLQFEWKIVAQYALKCRPCPRAAALPPHEARPPASNPNPNLNSNPSLSCRRTRHAPPPPTAC